MRTYTLHLYTTLALCLFCAFPAATYAARATLVIEPVNVGMGGVSHVRMVLDTEGADVNALEGSITIPNGLGVSGVSSAGSVFTLWPISPRYELSRRVIEFVGGVPGGVKERTGVTILSFDVRTTGRGIFTIGPIQVKAYLNDGAGTVIPVTAPSAILTVSDTSDGSAPSAKDSTDISAPEYVYADIGRDDTLFEGRYFLTVRAHDEVSDIASIEVREGLFGWYTPIETYYVLSDQSLRKAVYIRMSDTNGNTKVVKIPGTGDTPSIPWRTLGIVLTCIVVVLVGIVYVRRRV